MTPLPVIAGVFRVAFNWANDAPGQIAENVMHFRSPTLTAAGVGAALIESVVRDQWTPVVHTSGVNTLVITKLDGSSATFDQSISTINFTGLGGTEWIPAVAPIVSFATGLRGRSYRGRIYLPFCDEAAVADGQLVGTIASDLQTAWEEFGAACYSNGLTHVVASYVHATAAEVQSYACQAAVGTMRRRQTRVRYP